jgi:hypothetical protein
MTKKTIAKITLALTVGAVPIALSTTTAWAAPAPTPSGLIGACNMLEASPSYFSGAVSNGMDIAMSGDAAQGNAGMFHAVAVSGCS